MQHGVEPVPGVWWMEWVKEEGSAQLPIGAWLDPAPRLPGCAEVHLTHQSLGIASAWTSTFMPWYLGSRSQSRRTTLSCQSSGFSRGQGQPLSLRKGSRHRDYSMTLWVQNLQHISCEMTQATFLWQQGLPSQRCPHVCRCKSVLPWHSLWKLMAKRGAPGTRLQILPKLSLTVHQTARALNCSLHLARHIVQKNCWWNMSRAVVNERPHNAEQRPEPRIISWTFLWEVLSRVFLWKAVSPTVTVPLSYFWIYSASIYLYVYSPEMLQAQQTLSCPYILSLFKSRNAWKCSLKDRNNC